MTDYYGSNSFEGGDGDDDFRDVGYSAGGVAGQINTYSGGAGRDYYQLDPYYQFQPNGAASIILDFQAGTGGDFIILNNITSGNRFNGWDQSTNPFTAGYLQLVAADADGDGAVDDTLLRGDIDGSAGATAAVTMIRFMNVLPGAFTYENFLSNNFTGQYFFSPDGQALNIVATDRPENNIWNQVAYLSAGADVFSGGSGSESVSGGGGNDTMDGGGGADTLTGERGNDSLLGNSGDDTLYGSEGNDVLDGGNGDDYLSGQSGSDSLIGGDGADYLYDAGNQAGASNSMNGGAGEDELVNLSASVEFTRATGGEGRDRFDVQPYAFYYGASYATDLITDFQTGAAGDVLDLRSFSSGWLAGWDSATNPFSAGYARFLAADLDGDGAVDDLSLQFDRDGAAATYNFVTAINLLNLPVGDLVATNMIWQGNRFWSVSGGNALPIAQNDTYTTAEDTVLTVPLGDRVLLNDFDPEAQPLTAVLGSGPANGTLVLNANGSFTYTPNANFSGTDSFTYRASDGNSPGNLATVTLQVLPSNDAPNAVIDSYTMTQGGTLTRTAATGVGANDSDADGNTLTFSIVSNPTNGTLTFNPDGSFVYLPIAAFSGTDGFTYQVSDGTLTDTATVTIQVNPSNQPPLGVADSFVMTEDGQLVVTIAGSVLANDSDPNGNPMTAALVAGPGTGTLAFNADGTFVYTPPSNFAGTVQFTYRPTDGLPGGNGNVTTVTIVVQGQNDAPVADDDGPYAASEDTALVVNAASGLLAGDSDVDGNSLTASLETGPANGTVVVNANGSFTYTPNANFTGNDSFTYRVSDGNGGSDVATATITVAASNDLPTAVADSYTVGEDGNLTVGAVTGVLANDTDADSDPLTAVLVTGVSNGSLILNANGGFNYVPTANFAGTDSFTYRANDGTGNSATVTVTIQVTGSNDAPNANNDGTYLVAEDGTLTVNAATGVLANDTDPDGNPITAALLTGPANGSLTLNANGSFTYTPNANFNGSDSFTYRASDGSLTDDATVFISVAAVNDAPVAVDDAGLSTPFQTALSLTPNQLTGNDQDIDGNPLSIVSVGNALNGTVALIAGQVVFTPTAGYSGAAGFDYTVSDGSATDVGRVTLTVGAPANAAPVAAPDSYAVNEDGTLIVNAASGLLANDSDPNGNPLTAVLATGPANGTLVLNPNGSFTYTPNANFNGTDSFTYRASDGSLTDTETVTITVNPVNDAPVAVDDGSFAVAHNTALTIQPNQLLGNDSDIDGAALSIASVGNAVNGTVTINSAGRVVFTPTAGYAGPASFEYTLSDGAGGTDVAVVTLTVAPGAGGSTIRGTNNPDAILGSAGPDRIDSLFGDDTVLAGGGNDTVRASRGDDSVAGEAGNDIIRGQAGDDVLRGDAGADRLFGDDGNDRLLGGDDADLLYGGNNNDTLFGGRADDRLFGDDGDDSLRGEDGNDSLAGGSGGDMLRGDAGNDRITGEAGNDTLVGGNDNDILDGGLDNDSLNGGLGDDTLFGGEGNDTLLGGDGADVFSLGSGADSANGGLGDDLFHFRLADYDPGSRDTIRGGGGTDTVRIDAALGTGMDAANAVAAIEAVLEDYFAASFQTRSVAVSAVVPGFGDLLLREVEVFEVFNADERKTYTFDSSILVV